MQCVLEHRVTSLVKAFVRNKLGSVLMMSGLMMPVLLGFVGLGLDVTLWYMAKRQIQTAADAGAISAAHTMAKGGTDTAAQAAADVDVALNDFVAGGSNTVVTNIPPLTGAYTASSTAAETNVTLSQPLYFMGMFGSAPIDIGARGVAATLPYGEGDCVISLDPDIKGGVTFAGTTDINIACGVVSNSNDDQAILVSGSPVVNVYNAYTVGDIDVVGAGSWTSSEDIIYGLEVLNPYAALAVPSVPVACDPGTTFGVTTEIDLQPAAMLDPGRYCGGLKITASNVTFNPGVYIFDQGDFDVMGNSTISNVGDGVTFVFVATDGAGDDALAKKIGNVTIAANSSATLNAPTVDPYKGILFYQDPRAPCCQGAVPIKNHFVGGSEMILTGAIYFPSQEVEWAGGSTLVNTCLQIVANNVTFIGTTSLNADTTNCGVAGVDLIQQRWVRLVE